MNEFKMFGIAFSSALAMSLIAAGVLFYMVAGDLAIVVGATLAAAATYAAICVLCLPHVKKVELEPAEEGKENV